MPMRENRDFCTIQSTDDTGETVIVHAVLSEQERHNLMAESMARGLEMVIITYKAGSPTVLLNDARLESSATGHIQ